MKAVIAAQAEKLFETLTVDITKDDQDVHFMGLLKVDGHKVRVRIRSNSYAFQSWAYADIWSPAELKWNNIASIPHGGMKTPPGLCYHSGLPGSIHAIWSDPAHFRDDANKLLQLVVATIL